MAAIRAAVPVAPLVQAAAVVADPAEPPPSQAAALAENAGRIGAAAEQPLALNVNAQPDEDAVALLETQWAAPTAPSQMQNVNAQAEQDAVALLETVWATPIAPALMVYGPFDVAAPFDPLAAISDEAAAAGQGRSMFALMSITLSSVDYATLSAEWSWLMSVTSKADAAQLWTGPFQLPVAGVVTSPFGEVRDDEGVPHTPHLGVDLGAPTGTPVHAANDGVVIFVGPLAVRGNAVIINHGAGVFSGYYHLSRIDVAAGQTIRSGELVGAVGAIGLATGPHLHWDMIVRGTHTDSLTWVGQTAIPDPKQLGGAVTGSVPQIAKAPNYPTPAPQPDAALTAASAATATATAIATAATPSAPAVDPGAAAAAAAAKRTARAAAVLDLFTTVLSRDPAAEELSGLETWTDGDLTLVQLREALTVQRLEERRLQVRQLYLDLLGRDPTGDDDASVNSWAASILRLPELRAAIAHDGAEERAIRIRSLYVQLLGRDPLKSDQASLDAWVVTDLPLVEIQRRIKATDEYIQKAKG